MKTVRRRSDLSTIAVRRCRSGAFLMELAAATALFAVVVAIAVPLIASVTAIRAETQRRHLAQIELVNVMERIAAGRRSLGSLAAGVGEVEASPEFTTVVPDAALTIDVVPDGDVPRNLRVTARFTWSGEAGRPAAPVELTAFFMEDDAREAAP